jgi:hypothetical protein
LKAEVNGLNLEIKLKAGFFKTKAYCLTTKSRQIVLTPLDNGEMERQVIEWEELKSFSIISRNMISVELEIATLSHTYFGSISSSDDLEEIIKNLAREFGTKFIFQHGNIQT